MEHIDRAILEGNNEGFVKVHVRQGSDEIVGATVVAANAGDIISELTLAMQSKTGACQPAPAASMSSMFARSHCLRRVLLL